MRTVTSRADGTYVIEPHSPSHNVFQGQIKDGVLTITPANLYMQGELPFYFEIALRDAQMRDCRPVRTASSWATGAAT